jgi:hypothetical protein
MLIFRSRVRDQSAVCGATRFRYSRHPIPNIIDQPILVKCQIEKKITQETETERDHGNKKIS